MEKRDYTVENNGMEIQIEAEIKSFSAQIIEELIAERKRKGITQQRIADMTGMKAPNVARIESGRYIPTLNILMRYASALGKELRFELVDIEAKE